MGVARREAFELRALALRAAREPRQVAWHGARQ